MVGYGRHQRRPRLEDDDHLHAAEADLRSLWKHHAFAERAIVRRRHRDAQPDPAGASRQHRSDCAARHHRCGRGRHPRVGQYQPRGAAGSQRSQHPGAGNHDRHSNGAGTAGGGLDRGIKCRCCHAAGRGTGPVEHQQAAVRNHRRNTRLWRWR